MMGNENLYTIFQTRYGWIGCLSSPSGLRRVTLPVLSRESVVQALGNELSLAEWAPEALRDVASRLTAYFNGEKPDFTLTLDFSGATAFQRRVWEATRLIPYGETRSYGWVARQIRQPSAVRAVGGALGKNPLSIIVPCHRVLASDGALCGFGGGLEMKRRLLDLEHTAIK